MKHLLRCPLSTLVGLALTWAFCPACLGQTIITSFSGPSLTDLEALGVGSTPPDTMGCAGPSQFAVFINDGFAVYDKTGGRQVLFTDSRFWTNAGIRPSVLSAGLTDPRITYDSASGRWFASELTLDNTGNQILLGRSDSADPTGTWKATNFVANSNFGDYDTLGVDAKGIYVGVNNYDTTGAFTGVSFFSMPKADLLANPPSLGRLTRFDNLDDLVYGFTLQGVNNADAGPGHGVILAVDDALNYIDRTTINNAGGYPASLSTPVRFHTAYDGLPNPATQPSGIDIDAGDDRISGAVRQAGNYVVMANCVPSGSKDAVHWLVLNETNNAIVGEGIISDPNYDFIYPSIAINHSGKILLGFNRVGTAAPAGDISIYAALGRISNNLVSMGAPFLLKAGAVSDFSVSFDSSPYRWGDYSATMFDPMDEDLVWTVQEIPVSSGAWGTQITLVSLNTNVPALKFAYSGGGTAAISWPLSADPAYALESTSSLPGGVWAAVSNTPTVSLNQRVVAVSLTGAGRFFRLKK